MNILQRNLSAGLLAGGAILAGSPAEAQNDDRLQTMATTLGLPVNKTISHFNRATNTAFLEKCIVGGAETISCSLRTMGNTAQIDYTQTNTYRLQPNGAVQITANHAQPVKWVPDTFTYDYTPAMKEAKIHEWSASSPLARKAPNTAQSIIQNKVLEISKAGELSVNICSATPITEHRGLSVCMTFNQATGTVQTYALPQVNYGSASYFAPVPSSPASRSFNSYDDEYYNQYASKIASASPVFMTRE